MSDLCFTIFTSLVLSTSITFVVYQHDRSEKKYNPLDDHPRYKLSISSKYYFVPIVANVISLCMAIFFVIQGTTYSLSYFFSTLFIPQLVTITLYCGLSLMILPLFRNKIHSRTCAMLWIYSALLLYFAVRVHYNLFIIRIPLSINFSLELRKMLLILWAVGFVVIILYHVISHLYFRHRILQNASKIYYDDHYNDPIISVFKEERRQAQLFELNCPIYTSKEVRTPLTIGLSQKTMCIILPERPYDAPSLSLLFRHELVHISREDSILKLFMVFFTAMFWFNPLMWICQRQCADDLELSCDETVLIGQDMKVSKQYADLLLKTAADGRGFTTCLSGSARALRYRLKNILANNQRKIGGILIGFIICILTFISLTFSIAYNPQTLADAIINPNTSEKAEIYEIEVYSDNQKRYFAECDEKTTDNLLAHPIYQLTNNDFTLTDTRIYIKARSDSQSCYIQVYDNIIYIRYVDGRECTYYTQYKIATSIFKPLTAEYP